MACWSAENATKAYLHALKIVQGKTGKEPDVAEFISALAAGNNAQLMIMACAGIAGSITLALVAAAHQTGGRVVCILRGLDELRESQDVLGPYVDRVEFVIGEARALLLNDYKGGDFVLIDCNIDDHKVVFRSAQEGGKNGGALVVGYNALHKGSWWSELKTTQFLPIGEGLLLARIGAAALKIGSAGGGKRSRWVVKVDKCTGEEHVFRITSSQRKEIEA